MDKRGCVILPPTNERSSPEPVSHHLSCYFLKEALSWPPDLNSSHITFHSLSILYFSSRHFQHLCYFRLFAICLSCKSNKPIDVGDLSVWCSNEVQHPEPCLETWMDLEAVKESEGCQKEENKYCTLMHIWGTQVNGTEEAIWVKQK